MPKLETYQDGQLISTEDTRSIDDAQAEAIERIEDGFNATIASGITTNAIMLAADETSRNKFHQLITLLQMLGTNAPATITISDAGNATHTVTPADFLSMMTDYGSQVLTLESTRLTKIAAAKSTLTNADADAINWGS